ncbi:membrane protein [Francisella halioticida]|uniref:DUF4381 domain-containing protein n=1 Tax=Francisella halioticida TaxID=549298 RepID=A0ABM6M1B3_9GAMM|nr:DUF4381 domain-containing protein [Francisella halioticida]ASG68697.1 hypothetical protein CDV26_10160 [Francisella halioticida]BCD91647.1 membrane protein [Francisella halioticida]
MQNNNLLAQLKDIYLPDRISQLWPLAYGWWIVLGIIVLIIILAMIILRIKKKKKQYKNSIIDEFRQEVENVYKDDPMHVLESISVYLKRVAMQKFPNEQIKTLYGEKWLEFLDSKIDDESFETTKARLLENTYKRVELDRLTFDEIMVVAEKWLRRVI